MARKDTDKQYNITLSEENGDQLAEYCAKNSTSRNAAMNRAVELLTLDSIRSTAPDQAAYINDFEAVIDKILIFYRQAIERSLDADERARVNVREELKGMERLSKTNEMLEAERTHLMVKNAAPSNSPGCTGITPGSISAPFSERRRMAFSPSQSINHLSRYVPGGS